MRLSFSVTPDGASANYPCTRCRPTRRIITDGTRTHNDDSKSKTKQFTPEVTQMQPTLSPCTYSKPEAERNSLQKPPCSDHVSCVCWRAQIFKAGSVMLAVISETIRISARNMTCCTAAAAAVPAVLGTSCPQLPVYTVVAIHCTPCVSYDA